MMLFQPVGKKKTYLQIIEQFQQLIKQGILKPGHRIPSERELSEQLGISRASLREALCAMEVIGIVQSKKGSGCYIALSPDNILTNHFSTIEDMPGEITLYEILYAREVIEVGAVKLTAVKASDDEIRAMEITITNMEKIINSDMDTQKWDDEDKKFHRMIFKTCENRIFQKTSEFLEDSMSREFWTSLKQKYHTLDHYKRYLDDHRQILEAIRKRSPKKAGSEMLKHLIRVKEDLFGDEFSMD